MRTDRTAGQAAEPLDPVAFVVSALERRGALIESQGDRALALLPEAVRTELGLPSECVLSTELDNPQLVNCSIGSSLLERLIQEARALVPLASLRVCADEPPRAARAKALAGAVALRNGVAEIGDCLVGTNLYVTALSSWHAEADDRWDGLIAATVGARDQGLPGRGLEIDLSRALSRPQEGRLGSGDLLDAGGQAQTAQPSAELVQRLQHLLEARARLQLLPVIEAIQRRHTREYGRISEYFTEMMAEVRSPRRRLDTEAIESRLRAMVNDRDAKLLDLGQRFALRTTLSPVAAAWVELPAVSVEIHARRRKERRSLRFWLPWGALDLDQLACEGCLGFTPRPALCDDRLHVLCETCAPDARGRIDCPACTATARVSGRKTDSKRPMEGA